MTEPRLIHLHLVSDSTGETVDRVADACIVQFANVTPKKHLYPLVRTQRHIERILGTIERDPGPVVFTLVDAVIRGALQEGCRRLQVPAIPVLDPVIGALGSFLGQTAGGIAGKQHEMDAEYFRRIDAMTYALAHDDGQGTWNLDQADIVLVGVSRTSKTPTCLYLANKGFKAANVPLVAGVPAPEELFRLTRPLVIGLTNDPNRLVQIRRNRLDSLAQTEETDYTDVEQVRQEVTMARRLCAENNWPMLDVSRRSIEETAAAIIALYSQHRGANV
ncbi:MAG: pyruvate, water dikinase regulatory protein [Alphaproteobacteria bacterium]|nr:pyruvate, water dikinase regulatory protein [Alphaproteobacteria bacterium]